MPLHHVNASDAENFDTLGVTGLTLSSSAHSNLSANGGPTRSNDASRSSISKLSESYHENSFEGSRHNQTFASELPHSSFNAGNSRLSFRGSAESSSNQIQGSRHSFTSAGSSSHSYGRNTLTSKRQEPIYEDVDQHSGLHSVDDNDAKKQNGRTQQSFIPEEDETQSLSTLEDSFSVTGQQQQQIYYTSRSSFQQHPGNRFRQPRQKPDPDNSSVTSSSACRSQESVYSSQLESRVTKLSLELATTKALLDELQLENRRVKNEKDELKLVVSALEGENEQLHRLVDKLEKEKLLMSMEKTVGVVHSGDGFKSSFVDGKKEDSTFQVSTFRAEPRGAVKKKKSRRRSRSGDELEVPFRNRNETGKGINRSFQSDGDFSVSSAGDGLSVGGMSLHSIADLEHAARLMAEGEGILRNNCDSDKEEYDDNDPFATWSAPADRAKQDNKQRNWFQRGVEALNNTQKPDCDSEEMSGDPFDTCSKSADPIQHLFSGDCEETTSQEQSQQDRRGGGFQLFRGLRGNRGQNR
jgi:hypothetical protein